MFSWNLFIIIKALAIYSLMAMQVAEGVNVTSVHDFTVKDIQGEAQNLSKYKGTVLLIVNTASECGYTPQYAGLEALYQKYKDKGFVVLGFPCNDFGAQEPGADAEIKKFCELKFKVSFPMFAKLGVKSAKAHPLYQFLQDQAKEEVKWNFGKFLIGKNGEVLQYFASGVTPDARELKSAIESAIAK